MAAIATKPRRSTQRKKPRSWENLREYSGGSIGKVDREAGIIFNVRILGASSMNGRRYTLAAVEEAAPMYEGIVVNYDHPRRETPDAVPPVSDRAGWLDGVRVVAGGLTGNLHLLKTDSRANKVFEAAETRPQLFGLSHNVEGETRYVDGVSVVDRILQVRSVDIVSDPASTRSLFEIKGETGNLAKAAELLWGDYPGTSGAACPTRLTETKPARPKWRRPAKRKGPARNLSEAIVKVIDRGGITQSAKLGALHMMITGSTRAKSKTARQFAESITGCSLREIVDEGVIDEEPPLDVKTDKGIKGDKDGKVDKDKKDKAVADEESLDRKLLDQLTDAILYMQADPVEILSFCRGLLGRDPSAAIGESRRHRKSKDAATFYQKVTGQPVPRRAIVESRGRGGRSKSAQDFFKRVTR